MLPGIVYTSASIIAMSVAGKSYDLKSLFVYFLLMAGLYVLVYMLTFLMGSSSMVFGLVTSGGGAFAVFWLTDKVVSRFKYRVLATFIAGGSAWALTVLILVIFGGSIAEYLFTIQERTGTTVADIFLIWQPIVGGLFTRSLLGATAKRQAFIDGGSPLKEI